MDENIQYVPKIPESTAIPVRRNNRPRKHMKNMNVDEQMVQNAAKNIRLVNKRGRLGESELVDLLQMLAEGTSEKWIIKKFQKTYSRPLARQTIKRYRDKYAHRIAEVSRSLDALAIESGLTRRALRLQKLQALAEALEANILDISGELQNTNAQLIDKYLATLQLIGQETGDLGVGMVGDINFINMSNEELKTMAANKLAAHPDLARQLAETAGVRPTMPKEDNDEEKPSNYDLREL